MTERQRETGRQKGGEGTEIHRETEGDRETERQREHRETERQRDREGAERDRERARRAQRERERERRRDREKRKARKKKNKKRKDTRKGEGGLVGQGLGKSNQRFAKFIPSTELRTFLLGLMVGGGLLPYLPARPLGN